MITFKQLYARMLCFLVLHKHKKSRASFSWLNFFNPIHKMLILFARRKCFYLYEILLRSGR